MVWKRASLAPDALQRSTVIRNDDMSAFPGHSVMFRGNNYVWIYENGAVKLKSRPKLAFFSRQKLSLKVDDIKIKRKVSPFFFPLPVYLPFIFSIFCPFTWLGEGLKA